MAGLAVQALDKQCNSPHLQIYQIEYEGGRVFGQGMGLEDSYRSGAHDLIFKGRLACMHAIHEIKVPPVPTQRSDLSMSLTWGLQQRGAQERFASQGREEGAEASGTPSRCLIPRHRSGCLYTDGLLKFEECVRTGQVLGEGKSK